MSNTTAKGSRAENFVANHGRSQGWMVASLRHELGAGDQVWMKVGQPSRLVEVKAAKNIWQQFRKDDRVALVDRARAYHLDPVLANVRGEKITWYEPCRWPKT